MTGKHGTPEERFWRHVVKSAECWYWRATGYRSGYGALKVAGTMKPAHRLSWEIHRGAIPEGLLVCHTCDNRRCVRPDHLFLGTNAENMADMRAKGRSTYSGGRPPRKLTDLEVEQIRQLNEAGVTQRELAQRFGIAQGTISRNLNGKTSSRSLNKNLH